MLLCIAGITGSILVFWKEIDRSLLAHRFGTIIPTATTTSIPSIIDRLTATYAPKGLSVQHLRIADRADLHYDAWLKDRAEHWWQVFVNPYTGEIMGDRQWETSWIGRIFDLHYKLFAGETGTLIMGIVALLSLILSLTGIVLWPGWRRLITGFKIKWVAHPQRVNFDLHKVVGIITAVFLSLISFTGFAWNVPTAKVEDAIYAATFTPKAAAEPVSKSIAGKQPLALPELLKRVDTIFPTAKLTDIYLPSKPEDPFKVSKQQPQETGEHGNTQIALDRFTGEVILIKDGAKPSRAEAIISQFGTVHYGTFGGVPTRILYVFVGLAPTILAITGFTMLRLRRGGKATRKEAIDGID